MRPRAPPAPPISLPCPWPPPDRKRSAADQTQGNGTANLLLRTSCVAPFPKLDQHLGPATLGTQGRCRAAGGSVGRARERGGGGGQGAAAAGTERRTGEAPQGPGP